MEILVTLQEIKGYSQAFVMNKLVVALLFIILSDTALRAAESPNITNTPRTRIDSAWTAWQNAQLEDAERYFRSEAKANPASFEALAGLYQLLMYRQKFDQASELLPQISSASEWANPFFYANWNEVSLYNQRAEVNPKIVALMEHIAESADDYGVLSASANERLALYNITQGNIAEADRRITLLGALEKWSVIGPFDNISGSGFEKVFPPEQKFDPKATYIGRSNIPVSWFPIPAIRRDKWVDFEYYYSVGADVYYAVTFVNSPTTQDVHLRIGTSGSLKVFFNDALITEDEEEKNNGYDTYILPITLRSGWNKVMVKIGSAEIARCNFAARITDNAGKVISGLNYSDQQQPYVPAQMQPVTPLPNFAEQFYREKRQKQPANPLLTLLLAKTYLTTDKHIEAEAVLLDGLKQWPGAPFFMSYLIEAYSRSRKNDELQSTRDKLKKIDTMYVPGIITDFSEKLEQEDFTAAESILNRYEREYANTSTALALRIQLYGKKSQNEQLVAAVEEAHQLYPYSWEFASAFAAVVMGRSRDKDSAIEILNKILDRTHTAQYYWEIGSVYLSFSNVPKWEEFAQAAVERNPVACGYFQSIAEQYLTMQKPAVAEPYIKKALAISPQSGAFHHIYAKIHRAKGDTLQAIKEFREAIKYNPTDFDTRAELRSFEGKQSLFSRFSTVSTDSIIKNAPEADAYPDKDFVVLLEEQKRVIYENGASEYTMELIVRLFTSDAVDNWKEYSITTSTGSDGYSIEKAVSVKSDGSEVTADVSGEDVVFKSLAPGDIIHIRWRIRTYNGGRFSNKFWDSYLLNGSVPIRYIRFGLIVPDTIKFDYRVRNAGIQPQIRKTEDGKVYEWTIRNEPAAEAEIGMPSWYEVGKNLEFSNIASWSEIVTWYLELTRQQIKPSREVREQVAMLKDSLLNTTDLEKIRVVYDFITKNIRYSSIPFRQSAYMPQKARAVLTTKIGDCKDLATLFITMIAEFGIKAHYVLVNTFDFGYTRQIPLPSPWSFDHCIVAVETSKGLLYIDLTAPDYAIGSAPEGDVGAFALLIKQGVSAPMTLERSFFTKNTLRRVSEVKLNNAGPIEFTVSSVRSGSLAAGMRSNYQDKSKKDREKMLTETLSQEYQNVAIKAFAFENLDSTQQHLRYSMTYTVSDLMTEAGSFLLVKLPWSETLTPSPAFTLEQRTFPLEYPLYADTTQETLILRLPTGMTLMEPPKPLKKSSSVAEYSVTYNYTNGVLKAVRTYIQKKDFIEPSEYAEFKTMYNAVVKEDARQLLLKQE